MRYLILLICSISLYAQKPTIELSVKKGFPDLWGEKADSITGGRGGVKFFITDITASTSSTYYAANGTYEEHYRGTYIGAMNLAQTRHIIPRVSGNVVLSSDIYPTDDNLSWHGHLAPEGGLLITNKRLYPSFDNVILRFYRHKIGNNAVLGQDDPIEFNNIDKLAVDHSSFGWGGDESMTVYNAVTGVYDKIIVQNNIMHQSRYGHNTGSIFGFTDAGNTTEISATIHSNLYSGVTHRTPNMAGRYESYFRTTNNVVYDTQFRFSNVVGSPKIDVSYNYYKLGPTSPPTLASGELNKTQFLADRPSDPSIHSVGNIVSNGILTDPLEDNKKIWFSFYDATPTDTTYFTATPLSIDPVLGFNPTSANDAYNRIVLDREVGANRTTNSSGQSVVGHDSVDTFYLDAAENGTTAYLLEVNWIHPTIPSNTFMTDVNYNGIYDPFEVEHGITSSTDVILNWEFGNYNVLNTAGYDAFEIFSAYQAGDFDRIVATIPLPTSAKKKSLNSVLIAN